MSGNPTFYLVNSVKDNFEIDHAHLQQMQWIRSRLFFLYSGADKRIIPKQCCVPYAWNDENKLNVENSKHF